MKEQELISRAMSALSRRRKQLKGGAKLHPDRCPCGRYIRRTAVLRSHRCERLNGIVQQIEGLLGSEGSRALAEALLEVLREKGYVTCDGYSKYVLALPALPALRDAGVGWRSLLAEAHRRMPAPAA